MSEYFDTPVLVFSADAGELGERARKLIADTANPVTTPHALAECFNALTYRLGLPPRESSKIIARNTARFTYVTMDAEDYRIAIERVINNGLTGDKVYDALHLGAAIKAQALKIYTSNRRDFSLLKAAIPIEKIGP